MGRYFKESEFTMNGENVYDQMDKRFLSQLEKLRKSVGLPLILNSTYRTPEYNEQVGGVKNSYHTKGVAADIHCTDGIVRSLIVKHALRLGLTVGVYHTFIHVDDRLTQILFVG